MKCRLFICVIFFVCLFCGSGYADTGPDCPNGDHEFESHILVLNQEDKEGQVENICIHCGYSYIEFLPATGHHLGEWQISEATADDGTRYEYRNCELCGRIETRPAVAVPEEAKEETAGLWKPNGMDVVLSFSISGLWAFAGAALWYNSLVLNWYKKQIRIKKRGIRR